MNAKELRDARYAIIVSHRWDSDYESLLDELAELDATILQFNLLQSVLSSSADLVTRFEGELTERGTFAKFNEESDEFKRSAYDCYNAILNDDPEYGSTKSFLREVKQDAARELIDVIVTAGGMASWAGLVWADIEAAAQHVIKKNTAKTKDTHAWNPDTKTVERIGRIAK